MQDDTAVAAQTRAYVAWWAEGSKEDRLDLFEEIAQAERTGFPWKPAIDALSRLDTRTIWKTFPLPELAELREWAEDAGLDAAAERFVAAEDDVPYQDPGRIPRKIREGVMLRDEGTCQECGSGEHPQIDHIEPWSEGGSSTNPNNLRVLCRSCNAKKGARPARTKTRRRARTVPQA